VADGTVDAIATDHAPHRRADKEGGAPGFSGLETAFAVCYGVLTAPSAEAAAPAAPRSGGQDGGQSAGGIITLSRLSSLMSAAPARILGLADRGRIAPGLRADLCLADPAAAWIVNPEELFSRGKNSPFTGRKLRGRIMAVIRGGRVVFDRR
jgi:dihydroorotase